MKRAAAVSLLLVVALAGCSSPAISEDEFVDSTSNLDSFTNAESSDLVTIGRNVCSVLGEDDGWVKAVATLDDAGIDATDSGMFIAYSSQAFCPELRDKLPN